jgi:hypothetical protein
MGTIHVGDNIKLLKTAKHNLKGIWKGGVNALQNSNCDTGFTTKIVVGVAVIGLVASLVIRGLRSA